jgi:hypothetical protein
MSESKKPHACGKCSRRFTTPEGLAMHVRDMHDAPPKKKRRKKRGHIPLAHRLDVGKEGALAVWESVTDDMPDGAAMAMLEEFGLDIEDLM